MGPKYQAADAVTKKFDPRDYVFGRVKLPPDVAALPSQWFAYCNDTDLANGVQLASGSSTVLPIQIDDSAYFLTEQIAIISGLQDNTMDKATVQITDTTTSLPWSDAPVPLRDLAGKGDSPKFLSDPQILRPTATMNIQITNNTGSAAAFYVALIGRKIFGVTEAMASLLMRRQWFQYVIPFAAGLGASAVDTKSTVKVINDSDFLIKRLMSQQLISSIIGATGGALSNEVMMTLRDTNGNRDYLDNPTPARLLLGSYAGPASTLASSWGNGYPSTCVKPILVRRNSILQAKLTNKSTTAISTAFNITLEGLKVYDLA